MIGLNALLYTSFIVFDFGAKLLDDSCFLRKKQEFLGADF